MNKLFTAMTMVVMLFPSLSYAENVNCGSNDIERVLVQGDRDGIHAHENKMLIHLSNNGSDVYCSNGANYVFMSNDNPAYNSVLATVLLAYASSRKVEVWVNTTVTAGNAVEIAWITLNK
ncbi:MAG: hypothetical protein COB33_012415 [Thiotrichaceae bacterium]|nr:hypothetical protein [Thiotrichaceae bacterium]